ncbi:MAG: hypothetical protein A3C85_00605 [Candidatus Doudnabacteria bacterium RIFCSPHIGHO2_02_FULL_48_21]|uniref:SGNH hydrolase-type esterase domain-containing protein n=1 Tax=Candidatus Doudnabacteria bacterium RIFCSPLOWO2_02_FULL_48_13 TaxID=1817845 RepID=A0A1F5Q858_9BACT|nr:MAG: hypothetical protein A3K05_04945 [Candidatus Doudnabacteria bacterium RIFCSPHIGHO2_01_48_18]OGE77148.1 MAG: hypothetical protein A2668_03985 [Candidatus Doudnabacteria bacterium RIFCSPHIGHO2_01_FULL_48_180]OGE91597.1 MAG: hypothetical protein A3F44_04485 [Candidatus Doudnabacteria bacterium RIFCSPHIGHO2_12_FULL_47_25]OGE93860.1 MAG: hypothetical protein A3C85_00605 [Candidatus Doudnabacteria bacterium RIFCSPHIGHO2_02_FULL_48_21]OGE97655.1 MAG: hypothetical protein A3A83_04570 [Candidatu
MRLRFIIPAVIAFVISLAIIFLRPETAVVDLPEKGTNIIAFGDSLVTGYGLTTVGDDFVSLLSKRTGSQIINAGLNGDTTGSALSRLEKDVLSQDPRIVIVLLGGNDALRHVPVEETFRNLGAIIDGIHAKGSAVILVGVKGSFFGDKYDNEFDRLADAKKVNYIPDILKGLFGHADLMTDAIHPNARGHAIMADRIEPVLKKLLE